MKIRKGALIALLALPLVGTAIGQGCGQFRVGDFGLNSPLDWGSVGTQFLPSESSGLRMLTVREYDSSLAGFLGETERIGAQKLPEDNFQPFDNFTDETGSLSEVRIRAYESAADEAVTRFMSDASRRNKVLPCTPASPADAECFDKIVSQLGMLAFRRPLTDEEKQKYMDLSLEFSQKGNSYLTGLEVLLKFLLQHPGFLYRWEAGEAIDGNQNLFRLNDYELASRLSFTIWGSPPDLALIEAAGQGLLSDRESYLQIVDSMLEDERARKQIDFFHSAWFGYAALGAQSGLTRDMRQETRALLDRIVFNEDRPWRDILTSQETYVTRELADHYGVPRPSGNQGWVQYASTSDRKGFFGQGSFLAVGAKFGDTSPIQRGYSIRKNVFCEPINPPPPGIDVDVPPGEDAGSNCKEDKHHASTIKPGTSCISCHQLMDTIGFGLERYDALGGFRTQDPQFPECKISGEGEVLGYGKFNGPAALAQIAVNSGRAERCLVERWVQLSFGKRTEQNRKEVVEKNLAVFKQTGKLKDLIREFVSNDDFRYRKVGE